MVNDPIADMLIRLKNGYLARKAVVAVPFSKIKEELGKILVEERYIEKLKIKNACLAARQEKLKIIEMTLKYEGKRPALTGLKRISKPGVRRYVKAAQLPPSFPGEGVTIISTSEGLLTNKEAGQKNLGGEILCQIW
jgi:small subunit ribosomal protein S8